MSPPQLPPGSDLDALALPAPPPPSAEEPVLHPDESDQAMEADPAPLPPPLAEDPEEEVGVDVDGEVGATGDDEDSASDEAEPGEDSDADSANDGDDEPEPGEDSAADSLTDDDDEAETGEDSAADSLTDVDDEAETGEDSDADSLPDGDDEAETGEDSAADSLTDGEDEAETDEDAAADADSPTNGQEAEAGALSLGTDPVVGAMAVGALLAVVLGGALMLGATTRTEPQHEGYSVGDTRQPPLLCAGEHVSRACHPWGATSTASAPPPVFAVAVELPQTTSDEYPRETTSDEYPRVVSGAADWAEQHQRGGTSSGVPLAAPTTGTIRSVLLSVFLIIAILIAVFQIFLQ